MELITEENGAKKVTLHISTEKKEYIREKKEWKEQEIYFIAEKKE